MFVSLTQARKGNMFEEYIVLCYLKTTCVPPILSILVNLSGREVFQYLAKSLYARSNDHRHVFGREFQESLKYMALCE